LFAINKRESEKGKKIDCEEGVRKPLEKEWWI